MNDDDSDEQDDFLADAINNPFAEQGRYFWFTPEDLVEMGNSMEELEMMVRTGRLSKPEQIGGAMMVAWRSARH